MLVFGLFLLVRGRTGFSPDSAGGPLVRSAGFVLLLPMAIGFVIAFSMRANGAAPEQAVGVASTVELIALLACGATAVLLCLNAGRGRREAR